MIIFYALKGMLQMFICLITLPILGILFFICGMAEIGNPKKEYVEILIKWHKTIIFGEE
jgi:hypothetical protein